MYLLVLELARTCLLRDRPDNTVGSPPVTHNAATASDKRRVLRILGYPSRNASHCHIGHRVQDDLPPPPFFFFGGGDNQDGFYTCSLKSEHVCKR